MTDLHAKIRQLEGDLRNQGLRLFPCARAGERAHFVWCRIRKHLFRGGAVEMTPSALGLQWHREQLRRARKILVEMQLIKPRPDGLYVVGHCDPLDELARERFLEVKLVEGVLAALSGLMGKSNTRKRS